ncbi:NLR family member X1 isoform X1 [Cyprinodon tularosa]|uniref:NLR family member X1 isoform X1 n=1 Tax=Cyprinodon tularosa TaxID=77115 RepID=UPI0018E27EB8|nr:NLR family member X1 isoform X1 [Cyprinodon tularosa]
MSLLFRQRIQLPRTWSWQRRVEVSCCHCKTFSSISSNQDPIEIHKSKLFLWFSHLPKEEKQFGGLFSPETMYVDPLMIERKEEETAGLLRLPYQTQISSSHPLTIEELFEPTGTWNEGLGLNVLLYGAVGTGKASMFRKLVLDWCKGTTLTRFKLLLPFSCDDLNQMSKAVSLNGLVDRKYLHLKNHPFLSGDGDQAKDVLFLFNGMEKMQVDFKIGSSELCNNPNEPLPPSVIIVNLLRKYLLPEASIMMVTRLSAVERIPQKYVTRYVQICGFNDPDRQRKYFTSRLLQSEEAAHNKEAQTLIELLYHNLQSESQLAAACSLPSYCWLTCATLHLLHFTSAQAPIRTLTGIYTSFFRLNFGGEVLGARTGNSISSPEYHSSLMMYVVRTLGKLAFEGVMNKRTSFSGKELEQWIGGKTKTDEELHQLAVFQTDVLDFFLAPCVKSDNHLPAKLSENDDKQYVFAAPVMQEYLAALYVVLGENKSALEKLTSQMSVAIGQAGEDVGAVVNILSKFIPLRLFAIFNLLKLFPKLYEKISSHNKGKIARTMAAEMFRTEDSNNEDVLDQVEQSLLGVHGPQPKQWDDRQPFELYPIFMGGLLQYSNRVLLKQLDCNIKSTTVAQITRALRKYLVRELSKPQPPEEVMDLLVLLYEFQNPRLTEQVLSSIRSIRLTNIRMTSLKCLILSSVLSCTPSSYHLEELDLSSCLLTHNMLQMLGPAFRHARSLNLQFNNLGPDSCILLRDLLLEPKTCISSLQLCDNPLEDSGVCILLEALPQNQSLTYLSLMHTGMGDSAALALAERLQLHTGLQELNVAYNVIGDKAAEVLVDACRDHHSIHTVHLYLNAITDEGKQALYGRGGPTGKGNERRVRVLASVTEGSDISDQWHPILKVIRENASSWDRNRVKQQLKVFLRDLEWGREKQKSFWKRLHFRKVQKEVQETLQDLEKETSSKKTK